MVTLIPRAIQYIQLAIIHQNVRLVKSLRSEAKRASERVSPPRRRRTGASNNHHFPIGIQPASRPRQLGGQQADNASYRHH